MHLPNLACFAILLVTVFAGCIGGDSETSTGTPNENSPTPGGADVSGPSSDSGSSFLQNPFVETANDSVNKLPPGVVIADVSAGINVYHEAFSRPDWTHHPSEVIPGIPIDLPALDLTFGTDYESNLNSDSDVWNTYEIGQIYWIPKTNILIWTLDPYDSFEPGHGHPLHGSATGGAINEGCPECYILVVQDRLNWDGGALMALAELPWVDFVQSTVFHGGSALPGGGRNHARASLELYENGSLYFAPSGNQVVNGMLNGVVASDWSFPPWVVNVGGGHERCQSAEATSGQYPEFTGDFVQWLPSAEVTEGTQVVAGTSFSTPLAAGRFGKALWLVRQDLGYGEGGRWSGEPGTSNELADGKLTAEEMRGTFAKAAEYFGAPNSLYPGGCLVANAPIPTGPTPWVQHGWGHVSAHTSQAVADHLLGTSTLPEKSVESQFWMENLMEIRTLRYEVL